MHWKLQRYFDYHLTANIIVTFNKLVHCCLFEILYVFLKQGTNITRIILKYK